jgi:tRNA-splicing ligase RtcB
MNHDTFASNVPIKTWTNGVPFEEKARQQVEETASLSIVGPHVAVMPDVHYGIGSTVGSVVPTRKAIIPAAVGVDIGCGMVALRTLLTSHDVSDNAQEFFEAIAKSVPHGGGKKTEQGNWVHAPSSVSREWSRLEHGYNAFITYAGVSSKRVVQQLGTLGGGNHFIELCLDEEDKVWIMLHSGSRGIGNKIGSHFIELAKKEMERLDRNLPNRDLAYLEEGTDHFVDYVNAVGWAQDYAQTNRQVMLEQVCQAVGLMVGKPFLGTEVAINCHHNYVSKERHFGEDLFITRKGAVSARVGDLGIIPGSMGTKSFIVRGKGNADSFHSCSHGAGRVMPRGVAKRTITLEEHIKATEGVACRKDLDVIDESPAAYKNVDAVMRAQEDLVEIVHTLKQIVCVKG